MTVRVLPEKEKEDQRVVAKIRVDTRMLVVVRVVVVAVIAGGSMRWE